MSGTFCFLILLVRILFMQSVSFSMLHCFEGDHMLADYHVHTEFSDDSVYPLDAVCRDAISFHYGLPDL